MAISLLTRLVVADWKEPADGKFTEDQLKIYLDTEQDWLQITERMMQEVANSKSGAGAAAAVNNIDQQYQACLDKHQISKAEFEWIGQRALEAWGVVSVLDQSFMQTQDQLDSQSAENDVKLADARKQLAMYQDAQKNGVRVMTPQDRDAVIKSAKNEQQSALEEARQHGDDAATAETAAKQRDADAKSDDDLANNPPADLSSDDRLRYIDGKKKDAQAARDAAGNSRDREDDAKTAQAGALARAAAAEQMAAHPEIPQTEDDRSAVKSENDLAVTIAQVEVKDCLKQKVQIVEMEAQIRTESAKINENAPPENVAIMRKYADRYREEFQHVPGDSATQPSQ